MFESVVSYIEKEKDDFSLTIFYDILSTLHRDLNHSIALIFKQLIRLVDLRKRIGMRDQRLGIELVFYIYYTAKSVLFQMHNMNMATDFSVALFFVYCSPFL